MTKTTLADISGVCERAAFRMGLEACDPPGEANATDSRMAAPPVAARTGAAGERRQPAGASQSQHQWTGEQDRVLLAMHAGGMSPADMAGIVDIDQEQIQQRLLWLTLPRAHAQSA